MALDDKAAKEFPKTLNSSLADVEPSSAMLRRKVFGRIEIEERRQVQEQEQQRKQNADRGIDAELRNGDEPADKERTEPDRRSELRKEARRKRMPNGAFRRPLQTAFANRVMIIINEVDRARHSQYVYERGHTQQNRVARSSGERDGRERDARRERRDPEYEHSQPETAQADKRDDQSDNGANAGKPVERAFAFLVERDVVDGRASENHAVHTDFAAVRNFVDHLFKAFDHLLSKRSGLNFGRVREPAFDGDFTDPVEYALERFPVRIPLVEGDDHRGAFAVRPDERALKTFAYFTFRLREPVFVDLLFVGVARGTPFHLFIRLREKPHESRTGENRFEVFVFRRFFFRGLLQIGAGRVDERLSRDVRRFAGRFVEFVFGFFRSALKLEIRLKSVGISAQGVVVDRLLRNELLREELDAVVAKFASFPADDDVTFKREV